MPYNVQFDLRGTQIKSNFNQITQYDTSSGNWYLGEGQLVSVSSSFATSASNSANAYNAYYSFFASNATSASYAQSLSGIYSFVTTPTVDSVKELLIDSNTTSSVDWNNRFLLNSSNFTAVDWQNDNIVDSNNVQSINWFNRNLFDNGDNISLDWNNRFLIDTSGHNTVDWENKLLIDIGGNTHVTSIDWQNRYLIAAQIAFPTYFPITVMDWQNQLMYDFPNSNLSVDWNNRLLYDNNVTTSIDWNNRALSGNWTGSISNAITSSIITGVPGPYFGQPQIDINGNSGSFIQLSEAGDITIRPTAGRGTTIDSAVASISSDGVAGILLSTDAGSALSLGAGGLIDITDLSSQGQHFDGSGNVHFDNAVTASTFVGDGFNIVNISWSLNAASSSLSLQSISSSYATTASFSEVNYVTQSILSSSFSSASFMADTASMLVGYPSGSVVRNTNPSFGNVRIEASDPGSVVIEGNNNSVTLDNAFGVISLGVSEISLQRDLGSNLFVGDVGVDILDASATGIHLDGTGSAHFDAVMYGNGGGLTNITSSYLQHSSSLQNVDISNPSTGSVYLKISGSSNLLFIYNGTRWTSASMA
jgi:hypothetical protein